MTGMACRRRGGPAVRIWRRAWAAVLLVASGLAWSADATVKIGVLAFRPKDETLARWQPTADYLSAKIPGAHFVVNALSYTELEQAIIARQVDFVLTNPAHYVMMMKRSGLSTLATLIVSEGGKPVDSFGGVVVVRSTRGDLQSLTDLKGKTIATPDQESFGGYVMQVFELKRIGLAAVKDYRVLMTGMPHDAAFQAMLDGRADAAFVRTGLIESLAATGRLDARTVRVLNLQHFAGFPYLTSTRLYPEWPFSALPHVERRLAPQVAAAL